MSVRYSRFQQIAPAGFWLKSLPLYLSQEPERGCRVEQVGDGGIRSELNTTTLIQVKTKLSYIPLLYTFVMLLHDLGVWLML